MGTTAVATELVEILVGSGLIPQALLVSGCADRVALDKLAQHIGIPVPLLEKPFVTRDLVHAVKKLIPPKTATAAG